MGIKSFYKKNRKLTFIAISVVTSVVVAIAFDRVVLRKKRIKKNKKEEK